jgi:hypothetical protein
MTKASQEAPTAGPQHVAREPKPKARWLTDGWAFTAQRAGYRLSRVSSNVELAVSTCDGRSFAAAIDGKLLAIRDGELAAKRALFEAAAHRGLV